MRKEVIICFVFLLSISFISAFSWSDLLPSGITGDATLSDYVVNMNPCVKQCLIDKCSDAVFKLRCAKNNLDVCRGGCEIVEEENVECDPVTCALYCENGFKKDGNGCEVCECVEKLYDEEGRLTDYARSLAPEMYVLNFSQLEKLHPENYGNNYFEPGTYNIFVGDGFGKGDILIKFVEFNTSEMRIYCEIFKKEMDGNYYHYPTSDVTSLPKKGIRDLFGITLQSYNEEISSGTNVLTYLENCTIFYDYCYNDIEHDGLWEYEDPKLCHDRCVFEPYTDQGTNSFYDEEKVSSEFFSSIFPKGYTELNQVSLDILDQCYYAVADFLRYDLEKPRIGIKATFDVDELLTLFLGTDEAILTGQRPFWFNQRNQSIDDYISELNTKRCPTDFAPIGHELTHSQTVNIVAYNFGLQEGLAEFVDIQNGEKFRYECQDDYWKYSWEPFRHAYANLSKAEGDFQNNPIGLAFYATGYCFWDEFVKTYSYPNFVKVMQQSYQKSRGTEEYYVWDIMEEINGEPLSQEIIDRYSLSREATKIPHCRNCEELFGESKDKKIFKSQENPVSPPQQKPTLIARIKNFFRR